MELYTDYLFQEECESTGGQLAKISSDEEFTFLKEEAERNYRKFAFILDKKQSGANMN